MKFEVKNNNVHTLSSHIVRHRDFVQPLAKYLKGLPGSSEQKIAWTIMQITVWEFAGKGILTPAPGVRGLIMSPEIADIDGHVYASDKKPVFRELKHFRLLDSAEAFKEDGRRTLNRFMEKADGEMEQQLDIRSLSMVFWLAVARAIYEAGFGDERM